MWKCGNEKMWKFENLKLETWLLPYGSCLMDIYYYLFGYSLLAIGYWLNNRKCANVEMRKFETRN
jgi:hypothetical protein